MLTSLPPASGAVVMGTGIVSIALASDHEHTLSVIVLVIAAAVWVALAGWVAVCVAMARRRSPV